MQCASQSQAIQNLLEIQCKSTYELQPSLHNDRKLPSALQLTLFTRFYTQESPLISNPHEGIIVSNQSLVLQNVNRRQSGIYTCVAHNIEGDGISNPMTLNIRCKY